MAFCLAELLAQPAIPYGHSHNDYLQKRPLYQAVELGFGSIEIDVCLDRLNRIKVSHNPVALSSKKDIEEMYLEPIAQMIEKGDTIFKYNKEFPLTLIIDIKTQGDSTYKYLDKILWKYKKYITQYNSKTGITMPGILKISLTGGRPVQPIIDKEIQLVKIDMGLDKTATGPQFPGNLTSSRRFLTGQINMPYRKFLNYKGPGKYSSGQWNDLIAITNMVHEQGYQLRFYAIGNNEKVWKYLLDAGVDWINVDRLKKFARFYRIYKK